MSNTPEFNWTGRQSKTVVEFEAYLKTLPPPVWATHLVLHHTAIPERKDWRGAKSMDGMAGYYKKLGWSGGPNAFSAPDGIWEGTPLNKMGVHAYEYNYKAIGWEVVGDYNHGPWLPPIDELTFGGIAAVLRWANIPVAHIVPHRIANLEYKHEYKSCPGDYIYNRMNEIRAEIAYRLGQTPIIVPALPYYKVISGTAPVRQSPDPNGTPVINPATGKEMRLKAGTPEATFGVDAIVKGTMVKRGKIESDQWAHHGANWGFIWLPSLQKVT